VKIREIDLEGRRVVVERKTERWTEVVEASLPALLTCEKEIAEIPFAPLPDLIRSLRYEPEMWTMSEGPVDFAKGEVGVRGSPTIVYKMGTPPLPEPGEKLNTREIGITDAVRQAFQKAEEEGILEVVLQGEGGER
jgi:electron transfer flavoprotein beta subunit